MRKMDKPELSVALLEISEFVAMANKFGIDVGESDTILITNLRTMTELMRRVLEIENNLGR
jgi:hypothetical protein